MALTPLTGEAIKNLIGSSNYSTLGTRLLSDFSASLEPEYRKGRRAVEGAMARRGLTGSGIEIGAMNDYEAAMNAKKLGMSLDVMNSLGPYIGMEFQSEEAQKERMWQDYLMKMQNAQKKKNTLGSIISTVGGLASLFTGNPGFALAGSTGGGGGGYQSGYSYGDSFA